ncbi:S1 RNA-binding domain-containing protein, partial [Bacillus paranthracis]|nr:S1 RNA-binding domain-containing protein [Bacillus paranthracis]
AFISLTPGKDGLLHISEMRKLNGGKRVVDAEDVVSVGQKVQVEITKIDDRGKLSLSRWWRSPTPWPRPRTRSSPRRSRPDPPRPAR